ncbi:uncharacterized protein LOC108668558 [Hyalella azteca]|uniref:Uncharacterized protein LOC108668558 n=1 Tax=Hyalella azteca TaxID=294128 RepID=A0A8B7NCG4_HYAAZ|nr:uncharacterized protein LOC108668558 [Hyalella azteca]
MNIVVLFIAVGLCQAVAQTTRKPGLNDLPDDVSLLDLNTTHIDYFLADQPDVELFTECFLDLKSCTSKPARSLIKEILKLGYQGHCSKCNAVEQEHMHAIVYHFIKEYSTKYSSYWRRVLPRLGYLLYESD